MKEMLSLSAVIKQIEEVLPLITLDVTGRVRDEGRNYVADGAVYDVETHTAEILIYPKKYTETTKSENGVRDILWGLRLIEKRTANNPAKLRCVCVDECWNDLGFPTEPKAFRGITGILIRDGELCLILEENQNLK